MAGCDNPTLASLCIDSSRLYVVLQAVIFRELCVGAVQSSRLSKCVLSQAPNPTVSSFPSISESHPHQQGTTR